MIKRKSISKQFSRENSIITASNSKSIFAEQYRTIRTNIEYAGIDREIKTILVTSAIAGDGKSTTAANLASVFAQQEKKVLLMDTDLRKPTVHQSFSVNNTKGLTNVLARKVSIDEAIISTDYTNLHILTSGPIPATPAELLTTKAMANLLEKLKKEFDIIILDTPPLLAVADAQILAKHCDGVTLVVSSGNTEIEKAKKAKEVLHSTNANILGVVLNRKKEAKNDQYYYYGSK